MRGSFHGTRHLPPRDAGAGRTTGRPSDRGYHMCCRNVSRLVEQYMNVQ